MIHASAASAHEPLAFGQDTHQILEPGGDAIHLKQGQSDAREKSRGRGQPGGRGQIESIAASMPRC